MSTDNKSAYYDVGGVETIDIIAAKLTEQQLKGYLLGNCLKYACRLMHKSRKREGQKRDSEKLLNYAKWLNDTYK